MMSSSISLLLIIIVICLFIKTTSLSSKPFPSPNSDNNRVLGFILAFDYNHIDPLMLIFNEYVSMCEAGWDPTIILFTVLSWPDTMRRYVDSYSYCYRTQKYVKVKYSVHDKSIGIALGAEHRKVLGAEINNFDVFVYHEDDIVFKLSHLSAYLYETKQLQLLLKEDAVNHCIGFQRYRRLGWGGGAEQDIFEQNLLEETPDFAPICFQDKPYLSVQGNTHQAIWILTQEQILYLQERCNFLNHSTPSREHMSSFSLFSRGGWCGLHKVLPGERFTTFTIQHYYQQRHVSWTPVFFADENIKAGYHYSASPRQKREFPSCWEHVVNQSLVQQELKLYTPSLEPTQPPDASANASLAV